MFNPLAIRQRPWATLVRAFPPEEVTTVNTAAEVDPRQVGLEPADIDAIWRSTVNLYLTGLHPAIALCVRRRGQVIIDRAIGHARGNSPGASDSGPLVPATPGTPFCLFSSSKAIAAMLIHLLDERGQVHLDDPVVEYIPEFGRQGKEWVTVRHVLTHRAGIPHAPSESFNLDMLENTDQILEILYDSPLVFPPGRRLAYHAVTGGFILGEIIRRVSGRDIRTFLREEILEPLEFQRHAYGVRREDIPLVAVSAFTGPPAFPPYSWLLERSLGVEVEKVVEYSNDPRFLTATIPSGNIVANANEACRFYELLRNEGELDGVRIFEPRTVRRATAEQSYLEVDFTLIFPVRYGMGFMLGAEYLSIYGADTQHAFGHIGFTNVLTWADPEREISVAVLTSGKPLITLFSLYWLSLMREISRRCPKTGKVRASWYRRR